MTTSGLIVLWGTDLRHQKQFSSIKLPMLDLEKILTYHWHIKWGQVSSVTIEFKHIGRVTVPDYCWKALYIKKLNKVVSYSFRNDGPRLVDLHSYEVSLDSIQHLSKLHYFKDENTH